MVLKVAGGGGIENLLKLRLSTWKVAGNRNNPLFEYDDRQWSILTYIFVTGLPHYLDFEDFLEFDPEGKTSPIFSKGSKNLWKWKYPLYTKILCAGFSKF